MEAIVTVESKTPEQMATDELKVNVRQLIPGKLDNAVDVYIATADQVITDYLTDAGGGNFKLKPGTIKQIRLYLTAHYLALSEQHGNITDRKIGDSSEKYFNVAGSGLGGTIWGQQAVTFDRTKRLTKLLKVVDLRNAGFASGSGEGFGLRLVAAIEKLS